MGYGTSVKPVGFLDKGTGKHQSNMIYDSNGLGRCLNACDYKSPTAIIDYE
ncbi:MAG: hypothetical protein II304_03890 [Bacteroidales bacterium]|jgi:hypothetical protein|nr:hypothetical protein [Bacteroidales bacterium]